MSDEKPTDAQIVGLMRLRGNGMREQPRTELGAPVVLAWRGVPILEADAQAAWDRFHATGDDPVMLQPMIFSVLSERAVPTTPRVRAPIKAEPCSTTPDNFVCKSIGMPPCPDCGHDDCHTNYMRWEASRGITRPHPGCPVFDAAECRCGASRA